MPVTSTDTLSGPYLTNGATVTFPFTFVAPSASEVRVILRSDDGTETDATGYVVALNGGGVGGSVTFSVAPSPGYDLIILLDPDFTQNIEFENGSAWLAEPVNEAADRSALRDLALKRDLDRAFKSPLGETGGTLPSAADRAGKFAGFNGAGDLIGVDAIDTVLPALAVNIATDTEGSVEQALRNRRKSINVANYGYSRAGLIAAVADAPVDGATIWLPKGDYVIPSLFSFAKSNLTFEGEPGTRLIVDGPAVVLLRPQGTALNRLSNITIRGLEFFDPDPEGHAEGADESHGIGAVYVDGLLIEDCVFTNIGDESVEINRCTQATARSLRFNGAAAASAGGGGVTISSSQGVDVDGCWFLDTILGQGVRVEIAEAGLDAKDIRIRGNWFKGQQALQAISVAPGLANVLGLSVIGNQFDECAAEALALVPSSGRYIRGVTISGNTVRGGGDLASTGAGAVRAALYANSDRVQRITITGNEVYDWGASGADSAGHHGIAAWNAVISGNNLESCFDSGIVGQGESVITGNRSVGNGLAAAGGGRAGIQYGTGAIVRNNLVKDNFRGVHTRSAVTGGVIEDNTVTGNTIGIALNGANYSSRNRISGNATGISMSGTGASTIDDILINNTTNITDSGTGSIKRGRAPSEFVTKNNGTATVPSGETYVLVSHGLSNQTPGAKDISVTPTNNLGAASQFWVSNITSTGFRINVDVDPGGDATFAWQADIQ